MLVVDLGFVEVDGAVVELTFLDVLLVTFLVIQVVEAGTV